MSVAVLLGTAGCAPHDLAAHDSSASPVGSTAVSTPSATTSPDPDASSSVRVVEATPPPATKALAPVRLGLTSLDLSLPVIPVGVAEDGSMELPASVHQVGWYRFGPDPTEHRGTTVLAAHVDSKTEGVGPFAELRTVRRGASITLRLADGTTRTYRVRTVRSYPKQQVPLDSVFDTSGSERLVLITCGGAYDRSHGGYQDNVVVEADPR